MGYLGDYMVRVTIWKLNMNYLPLFFHHLMAVLLIFSSPFNLDDASASFCLMLATAPSAVEYFHCSFYYITDK